MKYLFYVNLTGLLILMGAAIWEPYFLLMGWLPFGILQIMLSIVVVARRRNSIAEKLAFIHLYGTLSVASLFLLASVIWEELFFAGMILSLLLAFLSIYMTFKQQQISRSVEK